MANNVIDAGLSEMGKADKVDGLLGTDTLVVNYAAGDIGQGLVGGFTSGSSTAGAFSRNDKAGSTLLDSVEFSGIERLRVTGTSQADAIYGGVADDVIGGGSGSDVLYGGRGADQVSGGDDNDFVAYGTDLDRKLSIAGGPTAFELDGGRGIDVLSISLAQFTDDIKLVSAAPGVQRNGANLSLESTGAGIRNFEILADVITGSGNGPAGAERNCQQHLHDRSRRRHHRVRSWDR